MSGLSIVQFIQNLWPCFQQHYPLLAKGVLEVVGGASVLAALMGKLNVGQNQSGFLAGLFNLIGKVGLNPSGK